CRRPLLALALLLSLTMRAQAYWQQHVRYDIRVTLIDSIHTLDGTLSVVYTNHSPDTLREVWFHLYSDAFQPGSMMDERALAIHSAPVYDRIHKLPKSEWGIYWINWTKGIDVDGAPTKFETSGTVMRVALSKPLAPGDSVTIAFPFREQIPRQIRRSGWMSREGVEYSMAQWYPKIAEYDREGWQHQEYVSREFYGVYGEFDVQITLPSRYTVGATGQCMNPTEVGHGYDQIAAGVKAGLSEPTADTGMTTWKFHADHVHDFAWVADDDYLHEWMTWQDTITIHAFYKQWARPYWEKNALAYSLFALSTYSHDFGPYAYRNFSCTMAGDGGMEYPQLIMITGYRPNPLSLAGVIAHEVGHQWFYGMLGSNETREAFMDEGFTTFATTLSMNALFGDHQEYPGEAHSWLDWFIPKFSNKRDNYRGYQEMASQGYEEPLDIPHDWFREDATAGLVYGKTAAILNMLEYTLGDSTFFAGMREYYWEWRFKHPHLLDFQRVMEKVSHSDLAWFFDEWFKTTRTVDYEAESVSSVKNRSDAGLLWVNKITLQNKGLAVMPIDLLLHLSDGTSEAATIPLAVNQHSDYHKDGYPKDGFNHFLLSWDWTAPSYTGTIYTDKPVSWFEIDTSWRLQDLNWLNNYSTLLPPGEWAVWKQLFVNPPIDK
ncbi:MAG: M1 family metallopeptidase, partial [Candidatus Kapaibacterium sp.]